MLFKINSKSICGTKSKSGYQKTPEVWTPKVLNHFESIQNLDNNLNRKRVLHNNSLGSKVDL